MPTCATLVQLIYATGNVKLAGESFSVRSRTKLKKKHSHFEPRRQKSPPSCDCINRDSSFLYKNTMLYESIMAPLHGSHGCCWRGLPPKRCAPESGDLVLGDILSRFMAQLALIPPMVVGGITRLRPHGFAPHGPASLFIGSERLCRGVAPDPSGREASRLPSCRR